MKNINELEFLDTPNFNDGFTLDGEVIMDGKGITDLFNNPITDTTINLLQERAQVGKGISDVEVAKILHKESPLKGILLLRLAMICGASSGAAKNPFFAMAVYRKFAEKNAQNLSLCAKIVLEEEFSNTIAKEDCPEYSDEEIEEIRILTLFVLLGKLKIALKLLR